MPALHYAWAAGDIPIGDISGGGVKSPFVQV